MSQSAVDGTLPQEGRDEEMGRFVLADDDIHRQPSCVLQVVPPVNDGRRKVTFGPTGSDVIHEIHSRRDYSPEEVAACWYSAPEFRSIKSEVCRIASLMERRLTGEEIGCDDDETCLRGLEACTRGGAERRKRNRMNASAAILHLRMRHKNCIILLNDKDGAGNVQLPTNVYSEYSVRCHALAHEIGLKDAADAYRADINDGVAADVETRRTWMIVQAQPRVFAAALNAVIVSRAKMLIMYLHQWLRPSSFRPVLS